MVVVGEVVEVILLVVVLVIVVILVVIMVVVVLLVVVILVVLGVGEVVWVVVGVGGRVGLGIEVIWVRGEVVVGIRVGTGDGEGWGERGIGGEGPGGGGAAVVGRWRVVAVPVRLGERKGLMEGVELAPVLGHVEDYTCPTGARVGQVG